MCVIACSPSGVRQPSTYDLVQMWRANPHGAGYMYASGGKVYIHKGFMLLQDFLHAVQMEHFTRADAVVYHFRIATQAGICSEMTHPFPLSSSLEMHKALDLCCSVGIAHNGIIPLTSDRNEKEFSDTSLFIARYITKLIRSRSDFNNPDVKKMVSALAGPSRFAMLDGSGQIQTIGSFVTEKGIMYSNMNHRREIIFPAVKNYAARSAV